jgi:hypothetical protein
MYVDEWKGEPQKGEMNEKFGLLVDTDFYAQTEMASGRYLDIIDNNKLAIKIKRGGAKEKKQIWYFHQQSMTIRTRFNN